MCHFCVILNVCVFPPLSEVSRHIHTRHCSLSLSVLLSTPSRATISGSVFTQILKSVNYTCFLLLLKMNLAGSYFFVVLIAFGCFPGGRRKSLIYTVMFMLAVQIDILLIIYLENDFKKFFYYSILYYDMWS